jgi:hypothetical protein
MEVGRVPLSSVSAAMELPYVYPRPLCLRTVVFFPVDQRFRENGARTPWKHYANPCKSSTISSKTTSLADRLTFGSFLAQQGGDSWAELWWARPFSSTRPRSSFTWCRRYSPSFRGLIIVWAFSRALLWASRKTGPPTHRLKRQ